MRTALIVEDEPEANKLLAMLVRLKGYEAVSAFTGREALEAIRRRRPDVVFLDLMLPDIDGFQVCREVKSDPATSLVPIVMVTARIAAENRRQGFRAGADEYLPKPYTPDQIFDALSDAAEWARSVEGETAAGHSPLEDRDDEFARFRARLRALLVARAPLSADEVGALDRALGSIRAEVASRTDPDGGGVSVAFRLLADRFEVTLRDGESGVALGSLLGTERFRGDVLVPGGFDQAEYDQSGDALTLVRYFRPGPSPGGRG